MNTEIQKFNQSNTAISAEQQNTVFQVVVKGDLKTLTADQKIQYIAAKCVAANIPIERASDCFEIVNFQGKEVLYAKKGFAEVVRDTRNVQCQVLSSQLDKDNGLYSVKVRASLPSGRSEESLAVIAIEGQKGKDLANLMMKCETKAKRRATLALCGLGTEERNFDTENFYDVDEIDYKHATLGNPEAETEPWNQPEPEVQPEKLTFAQMNQFKKLAASKKMTVPAHIDNWCNKYMGCGLNDVPQSRFNELMDKLNEVEAQAND